MLSFTTALPVGSQAPITFGVIGDLGYVRRCVITLWRCTLSLHAYLSTHECGCRQTEYSQQTLRHLSDRWDLTAILHAGWFLQAPTLRQC